MTKKAKLISAAILSVLWTGTPIHGASVAQTRSHTTKEKRVRLPAIVQLDMTMLGCNAPVHAIAAVNLATELTEKEYGRFFQERLTLGQCKVLYGGTLAVLVDADKASDTVCVRPINEAKCLWVHRLTVSQPSEGIGA